MLKHIKIQEDTHKALSDYAKKSETFDQAIKRLLDESREVERKKVS